MKMQLQPMLYHGQVKVFQKKAKATDCLTAGEQGHTVPSNKESTTDPRCCGGGERVTGGLCSVSEYRRDFLRGTESQTVKKKSCDQ